MSCHSIHPRLSGASFLLFRIKMSLCYTLTLGVFAFPPHIASPIQNIKFSDACFLSWTFFLIAVHPEALSFHGVFAHIVYPKRVSLALSFLRTGSQQNTFHILWKTGFYFFIKYVYDLCIYMGICAHECRCPGRSGGVWDPQLELQVIVSPLTES